MSKKNDCWGIEVGSHAIKAIRLVRNGDKVTVADFDVLPFKQILTTPDLNVDEAIQLNLDQFLSKRSVSRSSIVVSVPGNAAFAKFAKLPPVEPKRIPDIVKFEAVQQIPFPIDQVEWDYQVFSKPDSPDVEVGIFAITRERVNQFLGNFRAVGLEVDAVTPSPLAVYNAMTYDMELDDNSPGVVFMDIGTSSTDVIIVEEGNLWLRTLPKGGNNFTEALVRAFKLSYNKAEKFKREAATSKYTRQIITAMRPVFADLVQEMQRSLGFYQSLNRDANLTKLIGVGSTFKLPGIQKFLKQQLQIEVAKPEGFNRLEVDNKIASEFSENALSMVTAYGLALQGLGLAKVDANIMPAEVLKQRNWRSKQPWMMATAALFVAASVGAYAKYFNESQKFSAAQSTANAASSGVVERAQRLVDSFNTIQSGGADPRQRITNLRRILDYRDVWPKLMYDLDQASRNLQSQPELLGADYARLMQIPRQQRRRLYIEKITADYRFGAQGGQAAPPPTASGMSLEEIWGAGGGDQPPAPRAVAVNDPDAVIPPSFVITIEGTTPYREGPRLVMEHYLKWFRDNGNLPGRPYVINPDDVKAGHMYQIEAASSTTAMPIRPTPGPSPFGTNPSRNTQSPNLTENFPLFPEWPLAKEAKTTDWKFTVTFVVQLVRPEDARKAEKAEITQQTAPAANTETQP